MRAYGQDWTTRLLESGVERRVFRSPNSVEIDFGLAVVVRGYVGEETDRVSGTNGPATFSAPFDVDSEAYLALVEAQQNKNRPNAQRVNSRIDITASVDFGDGGRVRVAFSDCTMSNAGLSVSGRTDGFTTSSPTFTCATWRRLA